MVMVTGAFWDELKKRRTSSGAGAQSQATSSAYVQPQTREQQNAQVDRQRSARASYTMRTETKKQGTGFAPAKETVNKYLSALSSDDLNKYMKAGAAQNPLRKDKALSSYLDEDSLSGLDVLYGAGKTGLSKTMTDYMTKKANTVKTYQTKKLSYAQENAKQAQLEYEQAIAGISNNDTKYTQNDVQTLKSKVDTASATLRKQQEKTPSDNAAMYGLEQFLLSIRNLGRDTKSGFQTQVGGVSAEIKNAIEGKPAENRYIRDQVDLAIAKFGGVEIVKKVYDQVSQKEDIDGLVKFVIEDVGSAGGESAKNVLDIGAQSEADAGQVETIYGGLTEEQKKTPRMVGSGVGSAVGFMGLYALNPALGMTTMYYASGGGAAQKALKEGATMSKAHNNAMLTGMANVAIESVFQGVPFMSGAVKGVEVASAVRNPYLKAGIGRLIDAFGEGIEEVAQGAIQPVIDRMTYTDNPTMPTFDELVEGFGGGLLASVFLGIPVDVQTITATKAEYKAVGKTIPNEAIPSLIESGLQSDTKSTAYKAAENMQKKIDEGKKITDTDVGELVIENQIEIAKQQDTRIKSFISGEIGMDDLYDMDINYLADPQNIEAVKNNFGIELPENAKRADVYLALKQMDMTREQSQQKETAEGPEAGELTGYIMPDGRTLSFNDPYGQHAELLINSTKSTGENIEGINNALKSGTIRVKPGVGVEISIEQPPTVAQYRKLKNVIENFNGDNFYVDLTIDGVQYGSLTYQGADIEPQKIIRDIKMAAANKTFDNPATISPESKQESQTQEKTEIKELTENATIDEIIARTRPMIMTEPKSKQAAPKAEAVFAAWDAFKRKMVDSANTIATLGKMAGDKDLYNVLNNARQSHQAGKFMIGLSITGQPTYQSNFKGERVGKSLNEIWNPIKAKGKEYYQDFILYLQHVHNVDRMMLIENAGKKLKKESQNAKNKPVFGYDVTADHSRGYAQFAENKNPEYKTLAQDVYKYSDNLLDYRVDAGLISQEYANLLREIYPHYVPTFRNFSALNSTSAKNTPVNIKNSTSAKNTSVNINQTIKEATGGDLPLVRLDDAMTAQTMQVVNAAKKNVLGTRMLQIARDNADTVGSYIKTVDENEGLIYEIDDETGTIYAQESKDAMENRFTVYENGKPVTMDVSKGIFEGISSVVSPSRGPKWAVKANDMYKRLITGYNPLFMVRNFFRDLFDVGLYSKNLLLFIKNYPKAWKGMTTNGKMWQQYQALGGFNSSFFDYNKGLDSKHSALQRWTIDKIELANMMIEQAPRFAEFLATVEKGGTSYENLMQAMYNAADVTVNFGRSGSWGKVWNSTFVPFFNPSIQGFDRLVRRFTETKGVKGWTTLTLRAAAMGVLPSLLNAMMYDDDDEYQMIDDRTKDTYYLFKLGSGMWVKIPKGRALSIFGSGAQRALRAAKGEKDAWAGFIGNMYDQTAPVNPLTANIATPVISTMFNKTWYGGDIESQAMQNMKPEDRYDAGTSAISIWLGSVLKQSPKKINYLLDSYSGIIGDILLPLTAKRAKQNPFTKAFTTDTVYSNRISDDFYNMKEELTQQESAEPVSDIPSITDLTLRYINKNGAAVSDLYKQIREVENSDISNSEKLQKVRELRALINGIQQSTVIGAGDLQTAIEKYYTFDSSLSPEEQIAAAEVAYLRAYRDIFGTERKAVISYDGVEYELGIDAQNAYSETYQAGYTKAFDNLIAAAQFKQMTYRQKEYAINSIMDTARDAATLETLARGGVEYKGGKGYEIALKGGSVSSWAAYKGITKVFGDEPELKNSEKAQVLLDMGLSTKNIALYYAADIEQPSTKDRYKIGYAVEHGVRAESFVKRYVQKSKEEGEKEGSSEIYLVDGELVTATGEKTVDGTKKAKAMESLLNSGYTEAEKLYFYDKEYSQDDSFVWSMQADIPIDEYLKFKRDEITLHGEIDEKTGKTKTNSLKEAYINYVNGLNLNYGQKAIMLMRQKGYKLEKADYQAAIDYIISLPLSVDEKLKLADEVGLVVKENRIYAEKKK